MKKILSAALAALLVAAQGGLVQAADFEAQAEQTGAALPMAAALVPSAADFALLPEAQEFGAQDAGLPAAALLEFSKTALPARVASAAPVKAAAAVPAVAQTAQDFSPAAAPVIAAQTLEAAPRAAKPEAAAPKASARARLAQSAAFFKGSAKKDIMGAAERQDAFWAGAALSPQDGVPEAGPAPAPAQFEKNLSRLKAPSGSRSGAALAAAAVPVFVPVVIPAKLASLALRFAPYLKIGGIFLGAHLANKFVRRTIDKAGARHSWPADKISLYKSVSTIGVWGLGVLVALPVMGVALNHIVAAAGVTGVLVSIAAGDVINNVFEAARVLLARPFIPGGRVSVGGKDYTVESMGWHDLLLLDANGGRTVMPYTTLSGSVLAVAPESAPPVHAAPGGRAPLKILAGIVDSIREDLPKAGKESILRDSAVYLAAGAAAYLRFAHPLHWLAPVLPGLMAISVVAAAVVTAKLLRPVLDRIGSRFSWSAERLMVVQGAFQALLWGLTGGLALKSLGTSWAALGASVGFISLGVGLVTQNIISGFWKWVLVRFGWAFGFNCSLRIGETISSNGVQGVVSDINFYYIVLTLPDGRKAYVHYSIAFPFTKLNQEQAPHAGH